MNRILIIDDDKIVLKSVLKILEKYYQVYTAQDWTEANMIIFRNQVDVILMDVEMPGVNGDKIAQVLKETVKINPPIILLFSSLEEDLLRKKAIESTVDGYIKKTFKQEELLEELKKYITL